MVDFTVHQFIIISQTFPEKTYANLVLITGKMKLPKAIETLKHLVSRTSQNKYTRQC